MEVSKQLSFVSKENHKDFVSGSQLRREKRQGVMEKVVEKRKDARDIQNNPINMDRHI